MARTFSGKEVLEKARETIAKARTIEDLKQGQAVMLPLVFGLTMEETAQAIGVSKNWACQLRTQFIRTDGACIQARPMHGGRRRENMSLDEEAEFLTPFLKKAQSGGILVVNEIKLALDQRLGRKTALASTYNLLHRHKWRKLAPDKRHPKADVLAQEEWKKNSRKTSLRSRRNGREKARYG